jgi:hypothetical protein
MIMLLALGVFNLRLGPGTAQIGKVDMKPERAGSA